ncbi:hypothetical protein [Dysgonomonas alginatilytica]|uniref:hypothetical protein n=1 Tax=Dysgonomonas alginatilytica TaxID=1605892 RepID=UPI000D75F7B2|nr:hypothetical protein [Dysgonomonas alginatilytica]
MPHPRSKRRLCLRPSGFRPWRLHGAPDVRGKRKKQKVIKVESSFLFSLSEHLSGRAKGTVLIFCFVLHQGKMKDKPDKGAAGKKCFV